MEKKMKRFDGHVWNGSTVAFFGGRIPFCSWWRFFFLASLTFFLLCYLLVQSDLILGTLASFGSKYTVGGFLHGWALKCTTGSAFALALSLLWIFLFGLLVVFDQVGQVYRRPRCACWGQSKAWKLFPGLVLVSSEGSHLLHSQPRGQSALSLEHHALQVVGCYFQLSR